MSNFSKVQGIRPQQNKLDDMMKHKCSWAFIPIIVNITIIITNSPSDSMKGGRIAVLQVAVQGHVALLHLVHRHHRLHPHTHLGHHQVKLGLYK